MKCVQSWNYAKGAHWIWSNSSTLYIQRNLLPFTKENLLLVNAMRNNIKEHHLKVAIHKYKLSHSLSIRGAAKKNPFFWDIFPKSVYPPTHPRVFVRFGKQKVRFGSKKAIFGEIWGGFEGFGPCLGISHPTHPHLGKISQKNTFFFGSFPHRAWVDRNNE